MLRKTPLATLMVTSAVSLAVALPAAAGSKDNRAREAIAAAEAKLQTAEGLGAVGDAPRDTAGARAMLATAKEDFKRGKEETAVREAIQAQALADSAIGIAQGHKADAIAQARADEHATAAAARDAVAGAQDQAALAQQQANDANARAAAAEQSAAASAADAAAARAAAAQTPAPAPAPQVETTVTTQHSTTAPHRTSTATVKRKTTTAHTTTTARSGNAETVTATTKVTPQ